MKICKAREDFLFHIVRIGRFVGRASGIFVLIDWTCSLLDHLIGGVRKNPRGIFWGLFRFGTIWGLGVGWCFAFFNVKC